MGIRTKATKSSTGATGNFGKPEWEDAPTEFTRRSVVLEIYGDTGTGRTTLALTAPGTIAVLHAAEKLEGLFQREA